MSANPYQANLKKWDRVGNLNPGVTVSDSERPWFDSAPADWLPVTASAVNSGGGLFPAFEKRHEDHFVILGGKTIAMCREDFSKEGTHRARGRMVPAGLRLGWAAAAGGASIIEYGPEDVARRTTDITTGRPVAAPVVYTKTQVLAGLRGRGLLGAAEDLEAFISRPVGITPAAVYAWAGGDGWQPTQFGVHNYNRQHQAALLCDYVCKLPVVPSEADAVTVLADTEVIEALGELQEEGEWLTAAQAAALLPGRYGDVVHGNFIGLSLGATELANETDRSPLTVVRGGDDVTDAVLVNRVSSLDDLSTDGDYMLDAHTGFLFFYVSGGASLPTLVVAGDEVSFYHYAAPAAAQLTEFACVVGMVHPGDYLCIDANSNLRQYVRGTDHWEDVVGQVLSVKVGPHEELAKVKTYHEDFTLRDRMPGSATKGFNDLVTYANAADSEVVFNLLK